MIEDAVVGGVVGLANFLQHHGAFARQLVLVEGRVLQDVGDDIDGERRILGQNLGVVGGALAAGIGVQVAANRFDLLGNLVGAAPLRALKGHVFEQMRDAIDLGRLVTSADPDPGPERNRLDPVHGVAGDRQAAVQPRHLNRHAAPVMRLGPGRAWLRTKSRT